MVDMFFYRDTEEAEKNEAVEAEQVAELGTGADAPEWGGEPVAEGEVKPAGDEWGAAAEGATDWNNAPVTSGW
jgi:hypothetical protein